MTKFAEEKGADASLFVFFKPDQENSQRVLQELAQCRKQLADKKLYLVGIVGVVGEEYKW